MDSPELPSGLLAAGREYHTNLEALGLKVSALFWVYNISEERFDLCLVWPGVDRYGPLAIQRLLFAAYRASALPQTIDPFTVYLHSPKSTLVSGLLKGFRDQEVTATQVGIDGNTGSVEPMFELRRTWIYEAGKKISAPVVSRHWKKFQENVSQLAA